MESISSPSPEKEWMRSFSNRTSTPISFKCLTVESRSTVFLANLDMLLVSTMSTFPASQSAIRRRNSLRAAVPVPLIPKSAYTPAYSHSGFDCISPL